MWNISRVTDKEKQTFKLYNFRMSFIVVHVGGLLNLFTKLFYILRYVSNSDLYQTLGINLKVNSTPTFSINRGNIHAIAYAVSGMCMNQTK